MTKRWKGDGHFAIVTGASSGIGRELTKQLIVNGCYVIAVARRAERLQELTRELASDRLFTLKGDVCDQQTCVEALDIINKKGDGSLDLLVNNAGIGAIGPFVSADQERFRQIMEVNLFAPANWVRQTMPAMLKACRAGRRPAICNIGSVLGHRAVPNKSEYSASKFAIHGWSDALRAELSPSNIQVTLVSPSTTQSEFFDSLVGTDPNETSKSLGSWPPERVASATLRAIQQGRSEVILSLGGKALVYADRIAPGLMNWILRSR